MTELNPTFCRRLLISQLIATADHPDVPRLMAMTGWPRRTIQDIITALSGMGIEVHFHQHGQRNNAGYYVLESWGAIDRNWVASHLDAICRLLDVDQSRFSTDTSSQ